MSTITWDIAQLERKLPDGDTCPDGAIYTVHYTVLCEDSGKTSNAYGSVGLADPDPNNFTPYSQLTKEEVIGWVKTILGTEQVETIEQSLQKQIQQQLNPTTASGLPW